MELLEHTAFFSDLSEVLCILFFIGTTADIMLMDHNFHAMITGGAPLDFVFPALFKLDGQLRVSDGLSADGDHVHNTFGNVFLTPIN